MEKLTGIWELEPKRPVEILDLPGIYSIYPKSIDEELVINILGDPKHPDFPDMAIVVADASEHRAVALILSLDGGARINPGDTVTLRANPRI